MYTTITILLLLQYLLVYAMVKRNGITNTTEYVLCTIPFALYLLLFTGIFLKGRK